ncbi:glutathione S-transferase 2 isoform X1 [Amborella trichopoda]|uniref:glutathione S-transferase 2 isoform X1 n=1 Tax=Amborella trichopoda TaxID=13333 RepID=UPI0009C0BF86|nr:glutathione S-transferase 2 isoform X1 [Amborella trichopoda]XP_020527474.1 glutathione S-transferase 2 isoform X1 [Amborella trichopoda]|eukprot:XP_020527473.1 glutathione S-transferase 2 isoform X1 [Amborella trichopoda]
MLSVPLEVNLSKRNHSGNKPDSPLMENSTSQSQKQTFLSHGSSSTTSKIKLYSHYRSSCAWRVRIALNLKGLPYEYISTDLSKGEEFIAEFRRLSPLGFIPVLVDGDFVICDSYAILLYLEEKYPQIPLLPVNLKKKAYNLQVANIVSSSIQPLQMIGLLKSIEEKVGLEEKLSFARHHITKGFNALEILLQKISGKYATGDQVYMADIFLAPQISNAVVRFNIDMSMYPNLKRINEAYLEVPAFQEALPERQPDAVTLDVTS